MPQLGCCFTPLVLAVAHLVYQPVARQHARRQELGKRLAHLRTGTGTGTGTGTSTAARQQLVARARAQRQQPQVRQSVVTIDHFEIDGAPFENTIVRSVFTWRDGVMTKHGGLARARVQRSQPKQELFLLEKMGMHHPKVRSF